MSHYKIEEATLQAVFQYLVSKPFGEVAELVFALQRAEVIGDDQSDQEIVSNDSEEAAPKPTRTSKQK